MKTFCKIQNWILILLLMSCSTDYIDNYGGSDLGAIHGQVMDLNGSGLGSVLVTVADLSTNADQDGYFHLEEIPAGDTLVVSFTLADYASTHERIWIERD